MKKILLSLLVIVLTFTVKDSFSQMYWNQAPVFTNTNTKYISVPNSSSLNITGSFTIQAAINPSSLTGASKGIIAKGGLLGTTLRYGIRLQTNGKLALMTNGTVRLVSKSVIPLNQWTQFAAVYDSAFMDFEFWINGVLDTSASADSSDGPISNTDSLFIGISGSSTPFNGMIDDVRIWNKALESTNLILYTRTTMACPGTGQYTGLVLSMPMQNSTGSGTLFTAQDFSGNGNNGFIRNIVPKDLSDRPLNHTMINSLIIVIQGGGAYLTGPDNPNVSPTNKLTIETWIYTLANTGGIVYKGPLASVNAAYQLHITNSKLAAKINNTLITSNDSIQLNQWTHIAFTYFGTTGRYEFFVNGKRGTTGNIAPGNIVDNSDSIVVGNVPGISPGAILMDEFRIFHDIKSINSINSSMFQSINESNDDDAVLNAVYNFDGYTWGSTTGAPVLTMNTTYCGFNTYAPFSMFIQSPVAQTANLNFQKGFYTKYVNKRIPATGSTGTIKDTIEIPVTQNISDINIYVALNHRREEQLRLTLTSPLGASTDLYSNQFLLDSAGHIVTIFDSDADSSLVSNNYFSFSPRIKPQFDVDAIFGGDQAKGKWILTINDDASPDTGVFLAWGIQINEMTSTPLLLTCKSLVEGFYNSSSNSTISDTMKFVLRSIVPPYSVVDNSKGFFDSTGQAQVTFNTAEILSDYFLAVEHRNSIETWSSGLIQFPQVSKSAEYDFTASNASSFGSNMTQVDNSPVKFAVYGGDVNQDGSVDLTDIVIVFNDANNFLGGYVSSDVTGDSFVDLSDLTLTFNNSNAFVSKITP